MKKVLLFASAALVSVSSYAQGQGDILPSNTSLGLGAGTETIFESGVANKGTGLTDTLYYTYGTMTSGPYTNYVADYAAPFDSGRMSGINVYGNKGYAMLYRYSNINAAAPSDTTYNIYGLTGRFGGTKSPSSSKSVVYSVWKRETAGKHAVANRPNFFLTGLPLSATVATKSIPMASVVTTGAAGRAGQTIGFFSTPITGVNYDIYAGYTIAYTWAAANGDTIGLATVPASNGGNIESITAGDTLVSANIIVQTPGGSWKSTFDPGFSVGGNQVIYPIIKLSCPTCGVVPGNVKGYTMNNMTFFDNYPNPAVNSTNVRFALKARADVTISVMDATGKLINTIKETGLNTGEHRINVNTSALAVGTYVYTIETSLGDGIASMFTVAK